MVTRRHLLATPLAVAALPAHAATWPERPLRLIVSYPPGGPADILARQVGEPLSARLGEQVVIDNRAGANGNIGAQMAARAPADGYTLLLLTSSQAANMTLYRAPGYDVVRDFAAVTNIVSYPLLLLVHSSVPARSVPKLIALLQADPGRLTYASAGSGGGAHLAAELFCQMAGVRMTHVPYRGTGPGLLAVVRGEVSVMFAGVTAALPHVAAGRLQVLGVSSRQRIASAPDLPTIAEAGVSGY
jgi:tripartite-type tricarboxylate transporter receptor subunit TctC